MWWGSLVHHRDKFQVKVYWNYAISFSYVRFSLGENELNTLSYSILNRISNELRKMEVVNIFIDDERMLFNRTLVHYSSILMIVLLYKLWKKLKCILIENDYLYYGLFESVCKQHRGCYACIIYRNKIEYESLLFIIIRFGSMVSQNANMTYYPE